MSKTALALSPSEQRAYHPGLRTGRGRDEDRRQRAWQVAQRAADLLQEEFGATRVVAFGSLAHRASLTPWSDVDLAAWGLPADAFYRAVALVTGLSAEFKVDLVAPEDCPLRLRQVIEREGIEL